MLFLTPRAAEGQFIILENCDESVISDSSGSFSLRCEVKNLAAPGDFSLLAFCENASVEVTPRRKMLNKNEVTALTIRGKLVDKRKVGAVEIQLQWADYEPKFMVTKQTIHVMSPMSLKN